MAKGGSKSDIVVKLNPGADRTEYYFSNQFDFVIIIGQYFGLMPVKTLRRNGIFDVNFKWCSLKIVYIFLNILSSFVLAIFCILEFAIYGFQLGKSGTMVFYIMNCCGSIAFVFIAINWSSILNQWTLTEIALKSYGPLRNLKKRLILTSAIIAFLAIMEHIFFIINDIFKACKVLSDKYDAVGKYFNMAHPHAFRLFEFSYCAAFFVKSANILSTLTWTYTDAFIILISSGLAVRFTQLAKKIENKNLQNTDEQFWRETREDFNTIYKLSRIIDKHLSALVSISFVNNIYFICIQLYNSLKEREGFTEKVYFFYSFAYLLLRITSVTMYAAWINDESKKPLDMLLSVPPKQYSVEVSRFIELINTVPVGLTGSKFFMVTRGFLLKVVSQYPVGLTGSKFFMVTRGFLLKVVGTIITLELMFLQFGPLVKYDRVNTSVANTGDKCNITDS